MATPKYIAVYDDCSLSLAYSRVDDAIRELEEGRARLLALGWRNISITQRRYDYSDDEYLTLCGERMETVEEATAREAMETEHAALRAERDRADYERLRAKFGDQ